MSNKSSDNLKKYKEKRDFNKTSEPSGDSKKKQENIFVIQKHDASNLHYDFRLQSGDVLKSWAVPKGPSTDPDEKRFATHTEDHPLDYADFEGIIPKEEYGGGTVMVWDKGTFINIRAEKEDDGATLEKSYKEGKIEVWLKGEKLEGGYVLINTDKKHKRWLLKKMKDDEADARRNPVSTEPKSVKTGRTLNQIAKEEKSHE